jgi:hypothetical protein
MATARLNSNLLNNVGYQLLRATDRLTLLELAWIGGKPMTVREAEVALRRNLKIDALSSAGFVSLNDGRIFVSEDVMRETTDRERIAAWRASKASGKSTAVEAPSPKAEDDSQSEAPKVDSVDYSAVVGLYHKILPELNQARIMSDKRKSSIRSRWKEFAKRTGSGSKQEVLDMWELYFSKIADSDFLMGRKTSFKADLDWVIAPTNFVKIIEGRYDDPAKARARIEAEEMRNSIAEASSNETKHRSL